MFLKEFLEKKVSLKKKTADGKKSMNNYPACKVVRFDRVVPKQPCTSSQNGLIACESVLASFLHSGIGLSVVYDCGISWAYSLIFVY